MHTVTLALLPLASLLLCKSGSPTFDQPRVQLLRVHAATSAALRIDVRNNQSFFTEPSQKAQRL